MKLFMVFFLHQTTTWRLSGRTKPSCLWSFSYIKPQPNCVLDEDRLVVYGLFPTSNHNLGELPLPKILLFMVFFLHQTTTIMELNLTDVRLFMVFFLHQTTTTLCGGNVTGSLFMVFFLHQTTTTSLPVHHGARLFMVFFLHQTTTRCRKRCRTICCLWSFSYIKPQPLTGLTDKVQGCLWSFSYIKPQPGNINTCSTACCLWSFSYIKPQP